MMDGGLMMLPGTPYTTGNAQERFVAFVKTTGNRLISVDNDYRNRLLYCFDESTSSIYLLENFSWQTSFENMKFRIVHVGVSATRSVRIALDWLSGNIYWTDPMFAWIAIQNGYNRDKFKIIVTNELTRPQAITVDPINRFLFWSDIGTSRTKIERASLVGNHRVVIITRDLVEPVSIAIDQQLRTIIWIDAGRETIEMADYDGEYRKVIRRLENSKLHDLMVFMDFVCVTDLAVNKWSTINKLTGEIIESKEGQDQLLAVAMYSIITQPIPADNQCNNIQCADICVNEDHVATCLCQEGYTLYEDGLTCSEDEGRFHRAFIQSNTTHICLMDIRRLTASQTNVTECIYTSGSSISTFDIVMSERRIVVADGSTIYSVNALVSQSSPTKLLTAPGHVTGIAVNWLDRNVYWTMSGINSGIYVVSLSSRTESTLIKDDIINPRDIIVRPFDNDIIWVSGSNLQHRIEIAELSGRGRTTITTSYSIFGPTSLTFDENTKTLYFIDGFLKGCNIDGTEMYRVLPKLISSRLVIVYKNYLIVDESGYPFGTMQTYDKRSVSHIRSVTDSVMDVICMAVLDATIQQQRPVTVSTSQQHTGMSSTKMKSQSHDTYTSPKPSSPETNTLTLPSETTATSTLLVILVVGGIITVVILLILLIAVSTVVIRRKKSRAPAANQEGSRDNHKGSREGVDTSSVPSVQHPPTENRVEECIHVYESINEDQMMFNEPCDRRNDDSPGYNGYIEMKGVCSIQEPPQYVDSETTFSEHTYDGMYITPVCDRRNTDIAVSDCNVYISPSSDTCSLND